MALAVMNKDGSKKSVAVTLKMEEILFDVMNETFLKGRTIQDRTNHKEIASLFASEDEENKEKIMRSVKKSWGEIRSELSDYLDSQKLSTDNRNLTSTTGDLALNLVMPSNFNEAATDSVGDACHAFIVNNTVAEWYIVTKPDEAKTYFDLAQNAMELIRYSSSKRARPQVPSRG
ncbi:MAG: hypothetical protein J1E16_04225 [Muribaculaceae bacterium]|nr:hypothetical protein [Muribaculaceae bacterium]